MFTFAVVFEDGFALAATCREVLFIASREADVIIKGLSSREEAYVYSCKKHVERQFKKNPYIQPVLPKLEDLNYISIFRTPGSVAHCMTQRFFTAMHPQFMGIMMSIEAAVAFLEHVPVGSTIHEAGSITEAQNELNYKYLKHILPMGAYIQEPIPYCNNVPVDVIVPIPYIDWFKQHCMLPENLPFAGYPSIEELTEVVSRIPNDCIAHEI